jgi:NAD+ diphosphatase
MHVVVRRESLSSSGLLRGREILVTQDGRCLFDEPEIAGTADSAAASYLGTVDARPCFVTFASDAPSGATFTPLRAALLALGDEHFGLVSTATQIATWDEGHRFCARCAAPLIALRGERAKRCPACDVSYYPRIAPCVIVLIHDGARVLFTHKANMPFYALVAGFVEAGESLEEAVVREVAEETGTHVGDLTYFGSQTWSFPHQIMIGFYAKYLGGEIVVDRTELDEVAWFDVADLPPIPPRLSIARKMIDAFVSRA